MAWCTDRIVVLWWSRQCDWKCFLHMPWHISMTLLRWADMTILVFCVDAAATNSWRLAVKSQRARAKRRLQKPVVGWLACCQMPEYASLAAVQRGEAALRRDAAARVLEVAEVNTLVRHYSHLEANLQAKEYWCGGVSLDNILDGGFLEFPDSLARGLQAEYQYWWRAQVVNTQRSWQDGRLGSPLSPAPVSALLEPLLCGMLQSSRSHLATLRLITITRMTFLHFFPHTSGDPPQAMPARESTVRSRNHCSSQARLRGMGPRVGWRNARVQAKETKAVQGPWHPGKPIRRQKRRSSSKLRRQCTVSEAVETVATSLERYLARKDAPEILAPAAAYSSHATDVSTTYRTLRVEREERLARKRTVASTAEVRQIGRLSQPPLKAALCTCGKTGGEERVWDGCVGTRFVTGSVRHVRVHPRHCCRIDFFSVPRDLPCSQREINTCARTIRGRSPLYPSQYLSRPASTSGTAMHMEGTS